MILKKNNSIFRLMKFFCVVLIVHLILSAVQQHRQNLSTYTLAHTRFVVLVLLTAATYSHSISMKSYCFSAARHISFYPTNSNVNWQKLNAALCCNAVLRKILK